MRVASAALHGRSPDLSHEVALESCVKYSQSSLLLPVRQLRCPVVVSVADMYRGFACRAFGSTMSALAFSESKSKELHQSEMGKLQSTMGDNALCCQRHCSHHRGSRTLQRQNDPVSR